MGRIITPITVRNALHPEREIRCDVLVDTGTSALILPSAWKDRLGPFPDPQVARTETADQRIISGERCGPVRIQIEGFQPIYNEVIFMEMQPREGCFEPLLGYVILEQSQATVDMIGHRLVPVNYLDLK